MLVAAAILTGGVLSSSLAAITIGAGTDGTSPWVLARGTDQAVWFWRFSDGRAVGARGRRRATGRSARQA